MRQGLRATKKEQQAHEQTHQNSNNAEAHGNLEFVELMNG